MKIKFNSHWDHWRSHIILLGYEIYYEKHRRLDVHENETNEFLYMAAGFEFTVLGFGIILYKEFDKEDAGIKWMQKMLMWK
jgi:hypothetical protein